MEQHFTSVERLLPNPHGDLVKLMELSTVLLADIALETSLQSSWRRTRNVFTHMRAHIY